MPEIRVGLLAYGAIGHEHNQAVQATPGLTLTAVCDTNPERIDAARELAPDLTGFTDAEEMLDSGLLDLATTAKFTRRTLLEPLPTTITITRQTRSL